MALLEIRNTKKLIRNIKSYCLNKNSDYQKGSSNKYVDMISEDSDLAEKFIIKLAFQMKKQKSGERK